MSRIRILGASLTALIVGTAAAAAADIPSNAYPAPPPVAYSPTPAFAWTGAYLGLLGGYSWGRGSSPGGTITADDWQGGLYGGYNFQVNQNWVAGIEGDYLFSGTNGANATFAVDNPWDATLRGRVGYAVDRFLLYGTGGLALGEVKATDIVGGTTASSTKIGWTLGAGIEAAVTNNVTARVEYRYTDLGSQATGSGTSVGYTSNAILAGVGMKF